MAGEDRVNLVLQPGSLPHDLGASRYLSPQCLSAFVCNPDLRQKAARVELGEHCRVDLIGLDARFRDQTYLQRICDDNPTNKRLEGLGNRRRITGCLENDMVCRKQTFRKSPKRIPLYSDTPTRVNAPVLKIGDLGHGTRNI